MGSERIEVKWISSADAVVSETQKLRAELAKAGQAGNAAGKKSKEGADAAANSFVRLEKELRDNVKALKHMERGTDQFSKQRQKA